MAEILNLRAARKRKARADAATHRRNEPRTVRPQQTEKQRDRAEKDKSRAFVDGHRRDKPDGA